VRTSPTLPSSPCAVTVPDASTAVNVTSSNRLNLSEYSAETSLYTPSNAS